MKIKELDYIIISSLNIMDEQFDYEEQNQEYDSYNADEEYQNEYEDYDNLDLASKQSSDNKNHYLVCSNKRVIEQINEQIQQIMSLTTFEYNWAFLLYFISHWNKDIVYKLMDKENTHMKMISYSQQYVLSTNSNPECCEVCLEQMPLLNNSCGHKYCLQCWKCLFETSVSLNSELFPRCQGEDCEAKMNYKIIQVILDNPNNSAIKKKYEHLMFILYSKENNTIKVCPKNQCGKLFIILQLKMKPILCPCSSTLCTLCGNFYHFQLHCAQLQNWNKMVSDSQNKWIQIIQYKICPKCKDPIEKNQGCNHMTCRCKYQFCWICLSDWKTHGVCFGRQAHDKMQEQRKKMLQDEGKYREKLQNCKADSTRFTEMIKRVEKVDTNKIRNILMDSAKISTSQTDYLGDIVPVITLGLRFCWSGTIYQFFREDESLQQMHAKTVEDYCDYLDSYMTEILNEIQLYEKVDSIPEYTQEHKEKKKQQCEETLRGLIYNKKTAITEKVSQAKEFLMKLIQQN